MKAVPRQRSLCPGSVIHDLLGKCLVDSSSGVSENPLLLAPLVRGGRIPAADERGRAKDGRGTLGQ